MWTSILGMKLNCLYAEPKDWTQVAAVLGEAANHYTNDAGTNMSMQIRTRRMVVWHKWQCTQSSLMFGLNIFYSEEMDWAWHWMRQCPQCWCLHQPCKEPLIIAGWSRSRAYQGKFTLFCFARVTHFVFHLTDRMMLWIIANQSCGKHRLI